MGLEAVVGMGIEDVPIVLSGIAVFIIGMVILYLTRGQSYLARERRIQASIQAKIGTLPIRILSAIFYAIGAGLLGYLVYFTVMCRNPFTPIVVLGYVYLMSFDQMLRWLMLDQTIMSNQLLLWSFTILTIFVIPLLAVAAMYYFVVRSIRLTRTLFRKKGEV